MAHVLEIGRINFSSLVLYAETEGAFRLYEQLGFVAEDPGEPDCATHRLIFR